MNDRPSRRMRALAASIAVVFLASGCMVGPNYERPTAPVPATFKAAEGWVEAQPADAIDRGRWWTLFGDPVLDELVSRVEVNNQNIAAATAAYAQARALVREQRAAMFPSLGLDAGVSRSGSDIGGDARASSNFSIGLGAGWEPDVFGRLRRAVESVSAGEQASQADLASATLAAQAELATNYFLLRQTDAQIALLNATIEGYERSLQIQRNRYEIGVIAKTDVLQAQTQLLNTQADAVALRRQRAQLENAIAVLTGESPSTFSIAQAPWNVVVPDVPLGIPSTLLQRRPDIAAAERRVASANAQIGVAQAAFYPSFSLTGSLGLGASKLGEIVNASSLLWSLGVSAAQVLFNAGATGARVEGARAAHEEAVARYRQTVLSAFEQVENLLVASRVLEQQEALQREASAAADQAAATVENRYQAGQVGFTDVIVARATALAARRALVQLSAERQTTAIALIQALGGGWNAGNATAAASR